MGSYRRKVTVTEAEQWLGNNPVRGQCWLRGCVGWPYAHVHTMHDNQAVRLGLGDWVLPEPDGEHYYPVADSFFKANYEAVDDA